MRRIRHFLPILLAAIFWVAQVQGTVHGLGHLNAAAAALNDGNVPSTLHCDECASLAQAGAAPVSTIATIELVPSEAEFVSARLATVFVGAPAPFYRSRAPPVSPV